MDPWTLLETVVDRSDGGTEGKRSPGDRLRADGGERRDREEGADEDEESDGAADGENEAELEEEADAGRSAVDVTDAGEAEPAEPRWDRIDPDEIPEFEIRAEEPVGFGGATDAADPDDQVGTPGANDRNADPTAGRPNTARTPGQSRIKQGGTEGYLVALEICARLPDDIRLPDEAADLVPTAVEAELEEDIRAFAVAEFGTDSPSVETLSFDEVDDEIWMRLRLGIAPAAFADLDPDEIRTHALQKLEGLF
ncbi:MULTISPECIES: hypothetical protein [Natrialbaceae]|uniref:hypothetical protein n=1 Tax=Natrialbaceae TaxID=1644061 RepID=UPI00207D53E5|nr:hypothetical protein [Natronococcus sp. CG52]